VAILSQLMCAQSRGGGVVCFQALYATQETKSLIMEAEALIRVENKNVNEKVKIFYIKCIYHYTEQQ
jgi:hypothetical protein